MFQVSCQNIENFSRKLYFQVGGLDVHVLILVFVSYQFHTRGIISMLHIHFS